MQALLWRHSHISPYCSTVLSNSSLPQSSTAPSFDAVHQYLQCCLEGDASLDSGCTSTGQIPRTASGATPSARTEHSTSSLLGPSSCIILITIIITTTIKIIKIMIIIMIIITIMITIMIMIKRVFSQQASGTYNAGHAPAWSLWNHTSTLGNMKCAGR